MGALPENSPCAYCYERGAGYIPDGCAGPLCGSCIDLFCEGKFEQVQQKRMRRYLTKLAPVCKEAATAPNWFASIIVEFLIEL